ncbi:hypothetical protein SKAU_G00337740 [Synaphobranchus kaupii]|uniref:Uncharacterized protein n=1 Tax=Synaphobranchus kaupii TaxID=118154 RepID=A0A9Q1EMF2_SYNKA|nr:hypothetical protein SKAU_G00337740 [Synaphobranchus kaupii]
MGWEQVQTNAARLQHSSGLTGRHSSAAREAQFSEHSRPPAQHSALPSSTGETRFSLGPLPTENPLSPLVLSSTEYANFAGGIWLKARQEGQKARGAAGLAKTRESSALSDNPSQPQRLSLGLPGGLGIKKPYYSCGTPRLCHWKGNTGLAAVSVVSLALSRGSSVTNGALAGKRRKEIRCRAANTA